MNSIQLNEYLSAQNENNIFKGVFSSDTLPNSFTIPAAFIVNLSPSTSIGTHWISIFIDKYHNIDYFDSFGLPARVTTILSFLKRHGRKIRYVNNQLQHLISKNCGKFAAVFVIFKILNKSTEHFIELFNQNLIINDLLIENYYNYFHN
jgi:hypothetical protein